MQPFNVDEYFRSRQQTPSKLDQILAAREVKLAALNAEHEAALAAPAAPAPWTERLGVQGSTVGRAVNIGASLFSGASRVVGDLASLVPDVAAGIQEAGITEDQFQAYNRTVKGQAQPGDAEILNRLVDPASPGQTVLGKIQQAQELRKVSSKIDQTFDVSSVIDKRSRKALSEQLGGGFDAPWQQVKEGWEGVNGKDKFDVLSGMAKLLFNAGDAAVSNPQAAAEYIAENIPQLALGVVGKGRAVLTASNVGYGMENYRKGIQEYQAQHGGAYPPAEQRQYMAMMAASTALAEIVGDKVSLDAFTKPAAKAADEVVKGLSRSSVKDLLLGTSKATGKGVVSESITEGYQTFAEGEAGYKPATAKEIYEGAVIGGIAGGGLTGGGHFLAESANNAVTSAVARQEKAAVVGTAAKTGDITTLVDPRSPTFDPDAAITALQQFAVKEGVTPEERDSALNAGMTALGRMSAKAEELSAQTPEGKRELAEELATMAPDDPDRAAVQRLVDLPVLTGNALDKAKTSAAELQTKLNTLADAINVIQEQGEASAPTSTPTGSPAAASVPGTSPAQSLDSDLAIASAAVDTRDAPAVQAAQAATQRIINLSMEAPDALSPEVIQNLVENTANGLTPEQRSYFRVLSEAQVAANKLKTGAKVSQEVYFGDEATKQVGIAMYQRRFAGALKLKHQGQAREQIKGITKFTASHTGKANAVGEALVKVRANPNTSYKVLRTVDGRWEIQQVPANADIKAVREEARINGGAVIHKASQGYYEQVVQEATALRLARAAMVKALSLAFPGAPPVPAPTQAPTTPVAAAVAPAPVAVAPGAPAKKPKAKAPAKPKESAQSGDQAKAAPASAAAPKEASDEARQRQEGQQGQKRRQEGLLTSEKAVAQTEKPVEPSPWDTSPAPVEAPKQVEVKSEEAKPDPTPTVDAAPEAETKKETPPPTKREAWLAPAKEGKPEGPIQTHFKLSNLLRWVQQSTGNEATGTLKPLASVQDFLTSWASEGHKVLAGLLPAKVSKWNADQRTAAKKALDNARETLQVWTSELDASIPSVSAWLNLNQDFRQQDMMQFLVSGVNENGRALVPENVLTAMAYAAYQWVLDQTNSPAYLTAEQIREMHGRDESTPVNGAHDIRSVVAFEDTVISDLGAVAVQVLGIKATPDTPKDFLPRLQNALGTHALLMLERRGIVARQAMQTKQVAMEVFGEDGEAYGPAALNHYVGLVREGRFDPVAEAKAIKEANYASGGVVDMLFGSDKLPTMALTEKSSFRQRFAKRTKQRIARRQVQAVQQAMDTPHTVIPEMLDLVLNLGREEVLRIAGWRDPDAPDVHMVNRASIEANNLNLENQYDLAMEMMGLDLRGGEHLPAEVAAAVKRAKSSQWFIVHEVWKNYRVGVATRSLNQQTSKIHRYLFQRPAWKATINFADQAQVDRFLISLGQNLGMKVDTQVNERTLKKVQEKYLADGTAASAAADAIRRNEWTDQDKALVADFAAQEGMVALQALQALAKYREALATGAKSFDVTLLVGADGKTNGPILTHLALGAAESLDKLKGLLRRGGMFFKGDNYRHYSEFAQEGNQDLYQDLSSFVLHLVEHRITTQDVIDRIAAVPKTGFMESKNWITREQFNAFQVITGQLLDEKGLVTSKGRNLVKTPLTAFAFGSALSKAAKSMELAFIQSFYDGLESAEDVRPLLEAINVLIQRGDPRAPRLNSAMPKTEALRTVLDARQLKALGYAFNSVMGAPVKAGMESYFGTFIERRRALNSSIAASFDLYQVAHQAAKEKLFPELMKRGEIPFRTAKTGEAQRQADLSAAQEEALQKMLGDLLPVLHTDYSKSEGNLAAGMFMSKTVTKFSEDPEYQNKVQLAQPVSVVDTQALRKGPNEVVDELPMVEKPHLESSSMTQVETAPGAAGTPGAIHSSDSSIMHKSLLAAPQAEGLNVHDEENTGVDHIDAAARALNEATVDTFLRYSPAAEARDMLQRQMQTLADKIADGTLPASVVAVVGQLWADALNRQEKDAAYTPAEALLEFPKRAEVLAYQADRMRLQAITQMTVMDQYTWEGGQFVVTDAVHKQAEGMLAALEQRGESLTALATELSKLAEKTGPAVNTLSQRVKSLRNQYEGKREAAQDPIDTPPKVRSTQSIGVPGVIAPAVIEALSPPPWDVQEDVAKGTPVVEALNKLGISERVQVVEAIATAGAALPREEFSPLGELGEPLVKSDAALVEFLAKKGTVNLEQLAPVLDGVLASQSQGAFTQFNRTLLKQLVRLAPKDLVVRYVTPQTQLGDVLAKAKYSKSRGWFVANHEGRKEIYILSPDFKHSAIQPEVLLHEVLHGVLAQEIEAPQGEQGKKLVAELEVLRSGLAKLVEKGRLSKQWLPAVSSVHELVSWGMTNQGFQAELQKLSLGSLKLESRPEASKRLDGRSVFGRFLKSVLGFLMPGKTADARYENALGLLLHNTAGLFAEVNKAAGNGVSRALGQNLSMVAPNPVATAWRYTTQELFEALGATQGPAKVSSAFQAHLGAVLAGIVQRLHGPGGYLQANRPGQAAMTPLDVWDKAQATGETPFLSKITPHLALSTQEAFVVEQVEATVKAALDTGETLTGFTYTELVKLYREARGKLKPSDFKTPGLYEMVFKVEAGEGKKSDYLARFAALGLANEEFNTVLSMATERKDRKIAGLPLDQKLKVWFEKLMDWLSGLATRNVEGEPANLRLERLVGQLVDIEARKRLKLAVETPLSKFRVDATDKLAEGASTVRGWVASAAESSLVKESRFGLVKLGGSMVSMVAKDNLMKVLEQSQILRDRLIGDRQGFIAGMVNSIQGPNETFRQLLRMAKKNEKARKQLIEDTAKLVIAGFKDGATMSKEAKDSVTKVFLRTGLHTLLGSMTLAEIQSVVNDKAVLEKAIADRVGQLSGTAERHYYVNQAMDLGYFKATGKQVNPLGMLNGGNIARLYGTPRAGKVSEEQAKQVEPVIDELVALYALQYQDPAVLAQAQEVFRTEMDRQGPENGVEQVLLLHKEMDRQARERLFQGSEALRMHGYTPEIYNPHTSLRTARTPEERITLEEMGYTRVMVPGKDPHDPDQAMTALYVLKDGGLMPYLTGAVSLKGMASKGSARYLEVADGQATRKMLHARQQAIADMFKPRPGWDPRKARGGYMTPVLDGEGKVAQWRYLMSEANKDSLLERDNRVEYVLGALAGSIFDKEVSKEQNLNAVQALHDLYMRDRKTRPDSFAVISPESSSAEMRELYRMLPDAMQKQIKEVWGPRGMRVPYELLDIVFGYRKLSAARAFDKKAAQRMAARLGEDAPEEAQMNAVEEAYVTAVEMGLYTWARGLKGMSEREATTWARSAGVRVRRTERAWQEILHEVKDTIVVRGIRTMIGNVQSNMSLLLIHGISPMAIIKNTRVAWKGAVDYKRDRAELAQIQLQLASGYTLGNGDELRAKVKMLEDAIARNPVRELIEAGLMPTIVEDVETDFDPYSYKSLLAKKAAGLVDKVNPAVRTAGRWIYMTHDTAAYRTLSQITQLSDFVARYTLYQHLVTREKNPLDKADAIEEASESFVNYDIPMHRGMQYLDDMGITMFTKYFLYIQRVLFKLGKDKPVQMLLALGLHQLFGRMDIVTQSALPYRLGYSPFQSGPLEMFGAIGELPALQLASGLLGGSSGGDYPQ